MGIDLIFQHKSNFSGLTKNISPQPATLLVATSLLNAYGKPINHNSICSARPSFIKITVGRFFDGTAWGWLRPLLADVRLIWNFIVSQLIAFSVSALRPIAHTHLSEGFNSPINLGSRRAADISPRPVTFLHQSGGHLYKFPGGRDERTSIDTGGHI